MRVVDIVNMFLVKVQTRSISYASAVVSQTLFSIIESLNLCLLSALSSAESHDIVHATHFHYLAVLGNTHPYLIECTTKLLT